VEYYNVHPDAFRAQMAFLGREGFNVVTAAELAVALKKGREVLDRTVAITFDDGYRNNHAVALPLLRAAGLRATFYVATAYTGSDGAFPWVRTETVPDEAGRADPLFWQIMDWREVRALADAGMEVGSHSHTHPDFAHLDAAEIRREVEASVEALRAHGIEPATLAASFGVRGEGARILGSEAERAGLSAAFMGRAGPVSRDPDLFDLPRITILESDSLEIFARKLSGAYDALFALHPWWRRLSRALESPARAPDEDGDRVR
jgi:peptidoglycan/xylan/chitin deacetylase (PgdA/CDA1 family)